ncbi:bifunctional aminoglycoside phosphotransferase/ATP-binding protein [Lyngbya confervoides]|uniref:gluconokinase n=1 Tax=Lyngbya confervoides BDU141951 TaxID=1574623 RepID=A0ABD4T4V7_9CYAN|nr:bifunctional aminoglycoside phosphotransferase/ATP-binding protein [Lyngbya confervoides]MCM1983686.1 AAA family ATPase [Lyngbya confervoides BDU141951]
MDASVPPLIQQMLVPSFYDHAVEAPIQLLQTHISYVLLTGDYAYKVKKPANFGFLDFTTLDKRHQFCQEELRLNRRLSPEIYLEVVGIGERQGQYQIHAKDTEAVEYAVKMRQFPQQELFSQLFAKEALTRQDMETLAQQVAQFHAQAASNAEIQSYGTVEAVQQVDENNYGLSEQFIGISQTQEQLDQTRDFTRSLFRDHPDWFTDRLAQGKIRECHGDLHLNNICRFQGQIQVFDCIEFNQEFRNIDVMYDVAFLVMDLEYLGRPDLANAFLNTYLEQTGDYDGAKLLPLYLSMRAYIRGNVSSLALNDPAIASEVKAEFLAKAKAYYQLAWRYTQRPQGQLFLMSGVSGSGKSTVARQLAATKNAIQIRSDAVRKHLAGIPLQERGAQAQDFGGGIYTPEMTQKTYEELLRLGLILAQQGWRVILDAKYDRQDLREKAIAAAAAQGISLQILHCTAAPETIRGRLDQRTGDIADATADILDQQLASYESFSEAEQPLVQEIHTAQALAPQLTSL